MSKTSSTSGTEAQGAHTDKQPGPEQDIIGLLEDSEEKGNGEPSAAELPSGIRNTGPSQPSEPREQENASKVAPNGDLASQAEKVVAEKDQPNLGELTNIMKQVLDVLQNSTIVSKSGKDNRSRFWGVYKRVAEEHDGEFLERYTGDMDIVLVFSGLFSAVSTSFIVAMESNLSPDPSDTTNALLKQLVYIGLGNFTGAGPTPADPASVWSPTAPTLWIQMIAYASLVMSLLAAFGAVLGKQWLGYYKSNRYGRGSQEERGKRRQEKFDGIVTWYFDAVVQSFPVLLQISLLLFGIALGANMWYEQRSIAWVIIATTVFGFLFYSLTVMACLISPACPFQTPMSTVLRMLGMHRVLLLIFEPAFRHFQQLKTSAHAVLQRMLDTLRPRWTRFSEALRGTVRATGKLARRSLKLLSAALHNGLRSLVPRSSTNDVDSEAQPLDQALDVLAKNKRTLSLDLPDILTSNLEAPSIKWLLETSTDPEVFIAATSLVPLVEWPLDLDVSDTLPQLYDIFTSCVGFDGRIVPSLEEKASACIMAMSHLYCGRVLHAYPGRGEFLAHGGTDFDMFNEMTWRGISHANDMALTTTMNLCRREDDNGGLVWYPLDDCPDYVTEWLSHCLPYHFITGRVNQNLEAFALEVISKRLSSPSSPSNQIIANCTLLACVMVGVQFDQKNLIRIDKSAALPQVTQSLLARFQSVLWAWDGGDLDKDSTGVTRRAWNLLDITCRMLELSQSHYNPSSDTMRNLDVCRKIYSRARSSEQNDPLVSLAALRNALQFMLTAAKASRDPAHMWNTNVWLADNSHSPEDFDWLVEYLDYIYFDDQEAAFDILLLMGLMEVRCSPAKQHQFIGSLVACMGSNMPVHLRYAALRAAHIVREEIVSIDTIDVNVRDMVLTKLFPAILTTVCPRPGTTLANDPHHFHDGRDECYLELIFALASNSNWHHHLFRDHHIDRCISMVGEYCGSYSTHTFYLSGIFLRIAPEQLSVASLDVITEQQWWDMIRNAWLFARFEIDDIHCFEFLPVLVEGTKRYMQIALEDGLERLVRYVDGVLDTLEGRDSEQGEGESVTVTVKEFRAVASDMLEKLVNSKGVISS